VATTSAEGVTTTHVATKTAAVSSKSAVSAAGSPATAAHLCRSGRQRHEKDERRNGNKATHYPHYKPVWQPQHQNGGLISFSLPWPF
jgi:hypothetical protein